jgi:hypothetical protein
MPRFWVPRLRTRYAIRRAAVCQVLESAHVQCDAAQEPIYLSMSRWTTLTE